MSPQLIRPVRADDLPVLRAMIDAIGLFPSEMLVGMLSPFLVDEGVDDHWSLVEAGRPVACSYCAPELITSGTSNLLLIEVDSEH